MHFLYVFVGFAKKTFIPYKETFGLNFLQGRVIRIDKETQTVVLDNGKVCDIAMLLQQTKYGFVSMSAKMYQKWMSAKINQQEVRYSHLILCTGTTGTFPSKHNSVDTYKSAIQKYEDFFHVVSFLTEHVYLELLQNHYVIRS